MLISIQVDLDGVWTYRDYLGGLSREPERSPDPVYSQGLKSILELFSRFGIKATFFCVGRDLKLSENIRILKQAAARGHELANHTLTHPGNFTRLSRERLYAQINGCHQLLIDNGFQPRGFRSPAYNLNPGYLKVLESLGYDYDASILPSFSYPLLLKTAHVILKKSFKTIDTGSLLSGLACQVPYRPDINRPWKRGAAGLAELPVSVSRFLRIPLTGTMLFFCGPGLALSLIPRVEVMCLVLHGIDFVDTQACGLKLPFVMPLKTRMRILETLLSRLKDTGSFLTAGETVENTLRFKTEKCNQKKL